MEIETQFSASILCGMDCPALCWVGMASGPPDHLTVWKSQVSRVALGPFLGLALSWVQV